MKNLVRISKPLILLLISFIMITPSSVFAEATTVVVRVKAKDAMFVGSSLGGAYIKIYENRTNKLLSEGFTKGSVGNFFRVMEVPVIRGVRLTDDKTAKFKATIDLTQPTFVTIEAIAPGDENNSNVKSTTQVWLIPGVNIDGDGIIMEVSGLIVDIMSPKMGRNMLESFKDQIVEVDANVMMLCGCPIDSDFYWDNIDFSVKATLKYDGKVVEEKVMDYKKESVFNTNFKIEKKGLYELIVTAHQSGTSNLGVDKSRLIIK